MLIFLQAYQKQPITIDLTPRLESDTSSSRVETLQKIARSDEAKSFYEKKLGGKAFALSMTNEDISPYFVQALKVSILKEIEVPFSSREYLWSVDADINLVFADQSDGPVPSVPLPVASYQIVYAWKNRLAEWRGVPIPDNDVFLQLVQEDLVHLKECAAADRFVGDAKVDKFIRDIKIEELGSDKDWMNKFPWEMFQVLFIDKFYTEFQPPSPKVCLIFKEIISDQKRLLQFRAIWPEKALARNTSKNWLQQCLFYLFSAQSTRIAFREDDTYYEPNITDSSTFDDSMNGLLETLTADFQTLRKQMSGFTGTEIDYVIQYGSFLHLNKSEPTFGKCTLFLIPSFIYHTITPAEEEYLKEKKRKDLMQAVEFVDLTDIDSVHINFSKKG